MSQCTACKMTVPDGASICPYCRSAVSTGMVVAQGVAAIVGLVGSLILGGIAVVFLLALLK